MESGPAMRKALLLAAVLAAGALFALERVDLNGLWDFRFERNKSLEEMRANIRGRHEAIVKYFRDKFRDDRPIIVSETGVKADYGVRDPRGIRCGGSESGFSLKSAVGIV